MWRSISKCILGISMDNLRIHRIQFAESNCCVLEEREELWRVKTSQNSLFSDEWVANTMARISTINCAESGEGRPRNGRQDMIGCAGVHERLFLELWGGGGGRENKRRGRKWSNIGTA